MASESAAEQLLLLALAPPEGQRAQRGEPPGEHEPGDARPDQHLRLVLAHLRAPVGELDHLHAQLLHGGAALLAVALHRVADLLGGPRGHQPSLPDFTVAVIFLASSMASWGVGAP